jgi:hypothetical protein
MRWQSARALFQPLPQSPVPSTMHLHHGIVWPPRTSRTHCALGTSGCRVSVICARVDKQRKQIDTERKFSAFSFKDCENIADAFVV